MPARSDAIFDRVSEDIAARMCGGTQKLRTIFLLSRNLHTKVGDKAPSHKDSLFSASASALAISSRLRRCGRPVGLAALRAVLRDQANKVVPCLT